MKTNKISLIFSMLIAVLLAHSAFAQSETFTDPNVDYSFDLPSAKWKLTVKPSATVSNVEYVYGFRVDGRLEVRKLTVAKSQLMSDFVQDEDRRQQFQMGYVAGKEENFLGRLKGVVFNFEYVAAGKNMAGRCYFLRSNDTTVYVLRFTGLKDSLRSINNQTDSIARTFGVRSGT